MEMTMKNFVLAFGAISVLVVAQVNAQAMIDDSDGDGVYSMEELVVAFPDLTEKNFKASDRNGDGSISMEELAAAVETGRIGG
jgi:Ca2+-binding EF-hand superfamily protein